MKSIFTVLLIIVILFVSCATMQSISEKTVEGAPYCIDLKKHVSVPSDSVCFLPVTLSEEKFFFSPNLKPLQKAVESELKIYVRDKWKDYPILGEQKPKVLFGVDEFFAEDDDKNAVDPPLVFKVFQPSQNWMATWKPPRKGYYLVVEVNVSAYKVRQKNWKGSKEVEMGTGYKVAVPWLTSLDDPIPVVQMVGMVLDQDGKVVRAAAEGFYVKRTSFGLSLLGVSETITKSDIESILVSHKRQDLNGKPLAYKVALKNLIKQLVH